MVKTNYIDMLWSHKTDEEINILYNRNVLGSHPPQSLLNTLIWLNNSVQQLCWNFAKEKNGLRKDAK
jgi:hypothetical protein